jgi:predicted DNA-binding protein
MKTVSVKLTPELAERTEALKNKSGISEAAIIRQAIQAGLSRVEEGINLIASHESTTQPA